MSGTKRSTASLTIPGRLDGLVTVSSVPTANSSEVHLVERRWLEPGGNYQTQVRTGCRERGLQLVAKLLGDPSSGLNILVLVRHGLFGP